VKKTIFQIKLYETWNAANEEFILAETRLICSIPKELPDCTTVESEENNLPYRIV